MTLQNAIFYSLGLIVIHAVAAVFFSRREKKSGGTGHRSVVFLAGNCLLLLLFIVPSKVLPESYSLILFLGFCVGLAVLFRLLRYFP